jgi:[NiFe] hydrogenase assembly HybE family chaperone
MTATTMSPPTPTEPTSPPPGPIRRRRSSACSARFMPPAWQGLPFLNPALRVEAVGFRRRDGRWLGVLITPWFMNLMLLPDVPASWHHVRYGDTVSYPFPSGVFEFISAREADLGDYQICSLFSPMFDFADQDGARATALAVLTALFDAETHAGAEGPGTPMPVAQAAAAPVPAGRRYRAGRGAPVSKRDFLRGRWRGDGADPRDA